MSNVSGMQISALIDPCAKEEGHHKPVPYTDARTAYGVRNYSLFLRVLSIDYSLCMASAVREYVIP